MKKITIIISCLFMLLLSGCNTVKKDETVLTEEKPVVLYIVRHGKTYFNTVNLVQGWCDSLLTDVGQEQADALGVGLSDIEFVSAFASDLGRQRETAQRILFQNKSASVPELSTDIGLREANFGKFEGQNSLVSFDEVLEHIGMQPGDYATLMSTYTTAEITDMIAECDETGECETVQQVQERVRAAIERIVADTREKGGGNVLIVSSGTAIADVLAVLNPAFDVLGSIDNCAVTILEVNGDSYDLITRNDLSFLETGSKEMESGEYPEFAYAY